MSIQHICDGCSNKIVNEPIKAGSALTRDYCKECAKIAQDFLNEEEALRVELVTNYNNKRLKLIQKFSENKFLLPDVVYE